MAAESETESGTETGFASERVKAFVDAVVAIALTLLILPLMESVGEVAGGGEDALTWVVEHSGQLLSFLLSFVLIAMFWTLHHRLFTEVHRVTSILLVLLFGWMLTIVWLPVATAVAGRMENDDRVALAIYIGSLILPAVLSVAIRLYLRAHPDLHDMSDEEVLEGVAGDVAAALLFGVALVAALLIPGLGYSALFVMLLSGVVGNLIARMLGIRRSRGRSRETSAT